MSEYLVRLESLYEEYRRDITRVTAEHHNLRGAFSRLFGGSSGGPGSDSCNDRFSEGIKALVDKAVEEKVSSAAASGIIGYVTSAEREQGCPQAAVLMMQAVHGWLLPLVGFLSPADADRLGREYSNAVSGIAPLPVQKKLAAELEQRSRQSN